MLVFKGLQKTTLVDYPSQIACTFFLPKCNFRCGFCYNSDLVLGKETGFSMNEKQAFAFLDERKKFLDGVCITGGEPTLHIELPGFLAKVKEKGFLVKLDTNGSNPEMLDELIQKRLVDFVAMDVKAPKQKYEEICSAKIDLKKIEKSIALVREAGKQGLIDYEFRTTIVPLLSEKDILDIAEWLNGSKKFVLQQFHNQKEMNLIDKRLAEAVPFSSEQLKQLGEKLTPFFEKFEIRGL